MTELDEADLHWKHMPGALDVLGPQERERVEKVRDTQLERADDLLKGVLLYARRDPAPWRHAALTPGRTGAAEP